jgi:hypothetical protein
LFDEVVRTLMEKGYAAEVRLLVEGGKLTEDWDNVARHCYIEAMAAEALSELLGLDEGVGRRLASVAVAHDWRKRMEIQGGFFSPEDVKRADDLEKQANLDTALMFATTPRFLLRALKGEAMFLELVQFYIDDIVMHDQIVPMEVRCADAEKRNPNPDPSLAKELDGRYYWDVEREVGRRIEQMLFEILRARLVEIDSPRRIPDLVRAKVGKRIAGAA